MRRRVLSSAAVAVLALLAAGCSDSDGSDGAATTSDDGEIAVEQASFRTVVSDDGNLLVRVPADDTTEVSVGVLDPDEFPEFLAGAAETPGSTVYDLQPSGATFEEPVHVFRKVEVANLGLEGLAPLDVPVAYLFTTDEDGGPELMDDPRILLTPDAIWVGGTTDHFSPAGTVNQQAALSTDDVFRELLSSVTDAEGDQVIDIEPLVADAPAVPDDGPPPLVTTGGDVTSNWSFTLDAARFRIEADFDTGDAAGTSRRLDTAFIDELLDETGVTVTDAMVHPLDVQADESVIRLPGADLSLLELTVEVDPDTSFAPLPVFLPGRSPLSMRAGMAIHGPPTREFTEELQRFFEEEYGIPPDDQPADSEGDAATPEIPAGWDLRIEVVHTPLGPFPSFLFVPIDLSSPVPRDVFVSPFDTGAGDPSGDTPLIHPVPVGPGAGPFETELGIQCFCDYGIAVIGPTELPADEIQALGTVGAVHGAGAPIHFLTDSSGGFTLAPVGPQEGPVFEGGTGTVLFVP